MVGAPFCGSKLIVEPEASSTGLPFLSTSWLLVSTPEAPVAGVADPVGGLDLEEALPLDGEVVGVARLLQRALLEVAGHAVVDHVLHRAEPRRLHRRQGIRLQHQVLDLEAGGVDVGQVVGGDVELALQRHLPRQSDVEGVVHAEGLATTVP